MTPAECIEAAARAGIRLWQDAEKLRATGPKGALTPEFQSVLVSQKAGILALLAPPQDRQTPTNPDKPHPGEAVSPTSQPVAPVRAAARQGRADRPNKSDRCEKCGAVSWRKTLLGAWECRCGRYWYGRARRPEEDGLPELAPVPGDDGACLRCQGRVFIRRQGCERCASCDPTPLPPGMPTYPCIRCQPVDVGPDSLFCPECWAVKRPG